MEVSRDLVSKMLVLEPNPAALDEVRAFCDAHGLQGLRVGRDNILAVVRSVVDLGGVLLAEDVGPDAGAGIELARQIRALRPELPLFLRSQASLGASELDAADRALFAAVYSLDDMRSLGEAVHSAIFSMVYPNSVVLGILDIVRSAVSGQFRSMELQVEPPYLVRDHLVYGELFTLIPIAGSWFRGYMTLQTEARALEQAVRNGRCPVPSDQAGDAGSVNMFLGELTNLVWGAFKNRFQSATAVDVGGPQVPMVVNHAGGYISFGSTNPQLCIRCTLTDPAAPDAPPLIILHRFIFNLNWSPQDYDESQDQVDDLVEAGELELF